MARQPREFMNGLNFSPLDDLAAMPVTFQDALSGGEKQKCGEGNFASSEACRVKVFHLMYSISDDAQKATARYPPFDEMRASWLLQYHHF